MTTDPIDPETKQPRRFTVVDGVVLALAICALAAPFAARLQVEAHAASPQIAVRSEVSAVRSIDLALGYEEKKAEDAFFEGLGEPQTPASAAPIDLAIVQPERTPTPSLDEPEHPRQGAIEKGPEVDAQPEPQPATAPNFRTDIAVLFSPLILDIAVAADVSDEPPVQTAKVVEAPQEPIEEVAPTIKVIMTAPPTMTPFPTKRPFHAVNTPITVVPLAEQKLKLPIDVTPPPFGNIEEAPLPPLEELSLPRPNPPVEVLPAPIVAEPIVTEPVEVRSPPVIETVALDPPTPVAPSPLLAAAPTPVLPAAPIPAQPVVLPSPPPLEIANPEPVQTAALSPPPSVAVTPPPSSVVEPVVTPVAVATKAPEPARPPTRISNGPRIALVIAAAGLNENVTRFAIEALPAGVTLAFAPVKAEAGAWAREAKQDGHTVLVEIPLEPVNKSRDPGPLTLRVADNPRQNIERLDRALAIIPVADGASSYLGARFNAEERAVGPVVSALASRNLMLFENEPTSRSVFRDVSARANLPYARGVIKFDRDRNGNAVRAALNALEKQARRGGSAIGVGTALRSTISTVALWAKEAEKRGVRLVPITEVAR